jgi:hypothetical protein
MRTIFVEMQALCALRLIGGKRCVQVLCQISGQIERSPPDMDLMGGQTQARGWYVPTGGCVDHQVDR